MGEMKSKLQLFRDSLANNDSLLKFNLRSEILRDLDSQPTDRQDRGEAFELLALSWLKDGEIGKIPSHHQVPHSLANLAVAEAGQRQLMELVFWAQNDSYLNPSLFLTLLETVLVEAKEPNTVEHERKITLLLSGLSQESRLFWRRIQSQLVCDRIFELEIWPLERTIFYRGQRMDLRSKKSLFQILNILLESPTLSVEDAIQILWQSTAEESYFARLRTATQRLNEILNQILPLQKPVELNSRNLSLSPLLRLKLATV